MGRPNLRKRVAGTWRAVEPRIGQRVVMWLPELYRGSGGVIVATPADAMLGVRPAPGGKVRVAIDGANGKPGAVVVSTPETIFPDDERKLRVEDVKKWN